MNRIIKEKDIKNSQNSKNTKVKKNKPKPAKQGKVVPTASGESLAPENIAIEVNNLVKTFGKTKALDGVSLKIPRGMVYGILGPNGAGKTTTIRILSTLLAPSQGSATVLGHDIVKEPQAVRAKICLTGQHASVDEDLTGQENLIMIARLMGLGWKASRQRATELLEAFGLSEAAKKLARTYSGGMRRRLDIAAGLIFTPEIVFLDEPTTGLDPRSRNQVWDIVRSIAAGGATVLLTTQYMEEADRLADRLAVIDHGKVIAEGTAAELKNSVGASSLRVRLYNAKDCSAAKTLMKKIKGIDVHSDGDMLGFTASVANESDVAKAFSALSRQKLRLAEFAVGQPTMDEVFFALTGAPTAVENNQVEGN